MMIGRTVLKRKYFIDPSHSLDSHYVLPEKRINDREIYEPVVEIFIKTKLKQYNLGGFVSIASVFKEVRQAENRAQR